jgi:hypothetical protein
MKSDNMVETPTLLIHDITGHIALIPKPGLPPNAYFEQFADPMEMGLFTHALPKDIKEKLDPEVLEHIISNVWNKKESVISVGQHNPYTPLPQNFFGSLLKYSRSKYEALLSSNPKIRERLNLKQLKKSEQANVINAFTQINTKHKDYNSARFTLLTKVVIPAFENLQGLPKVSLKSFEKEAFPQGFPNAPEYKLWRKEALNIENSN